MNLRSPTTAYRV